MQVQIFKKFSQFLRSVLMRYGSWSAFAEIILVSTAVFIGIGTGVLAALLPWATMVSLLVLKVLGTTLTLGSGNSGGVFAPNLFMGAVLGGLIGSIAHTFWPGIATNPGAYALVGMAAMLGAAEHAPITAVLLVFEMSGDYQLIVPLLLTTVLASLVSEALSKCLMGIMSLSGVYSCKV